MREIATKEDRPGVARDAGNIENLPAVVVIGVESNTAGLNCGYCGKPSCEALEEAVNGVCAFNSIDLGIATASAAEVAGPVAPGQPRDVFHWSRLPGPGFVRAEG